MAGGGLWFRYDVSVREVLPTKDPRLSADAARALWWHLTAHRHPLVGEILEALDGPFAQPSDAQVIREAINDDVSEPTAEDPATKALPAPRA